MGPSAVLDAVVKRKIPRVACVIVVVVVVVFQGLDFLACSDSEFIF
jgi:hypothetical protein